VIVKFCGTMKTLIELAPVVLHILYTAGNVLAGFVQPYILSYLLLLFIIIYDMCWAFCPYGEAV